MSAVRLNGVSQKLSLRPLHGKLLGDLINLGSYFKEGILRGFFKTAKFEDSVQNPRATSKADTVHLHPRAQVHACRHASIPQTPHAPRALVVTVP